MSRLKLGELPSLYSPNGRDLDNRLPINDNFVQASPVQPIYEINGENVTYSQAMQLADNRTSLKPTDYNRVDHHPNNDDTIGIYQSPRITLSPNTTQSPIITTQPTTPSSNIVQSRVSRNIPIESNVNSKDSGQSNVIRRESDEVPRDPPEGYIEGPDKIVSRVPKNPPTTSSSNIVQSRVSHNIPIESNVNSKDSGQSNVIRRESDEVPRDPPEGYIEGPDKIVSRMPKNPPKNVVYVNRGDPVKTALVTELPDNVDPNTVTVDQLRGYAQNKRLMLYKKIPVKFNEGSLIDWSKFSNEFKGRMFGEITRKYIAMVTHNKDILGDTSPYIRKFQSIEEAYEAYIELKRVVDTRWLRGLVKSGIVLFYTGIGYVLDNWYDLNTATAINLIIRNGISDDLINRLDISTNVTNKVMTGGGVPVILKLIGLVIFNVILVYAVCRFLDSDSMVHTAIGKLSQTANNISTTGTIDMQQVIEAGGPFVGLITSRLMAPSTESQASPAPSTPPPTSHSSSSSSDDYDIDEE